MREVEAATAADADPAAAADSCTAAEATEDAEDALDAAVVIAASAAAVVAEAASAAVVAMVMLLKKRSILEWVCGRVARRTMMRAFRFHGVLVPLVAGFALLRAGEAREGCLR
jgi:hypothetical protein